MQQRKKLIFRAKRKGNVEILIGTKNTLSHQLFSFFLSFFFFPENLQGAIKELMTTTILEPVYYSVIQGKTNLK
jgi:hypothetical protein